MKKVILYITVMMLCLLLVQLSALAGCGPAQKDKPLPDISLFIPENPDQRSYLGLSGTGNFKIPQIKSEIVIVEIFSMYCPYCQREAPEVNRLYGLIQQKPKLKDKIKLIGIGVGNSSFEVEIFRTKYEVPFPLFPDEDFSIHKCLGEVRTPYFIGIKIDKNGNHKVFYSELGGLKGADQFLELMLKLSGLQKEE